MQRQSVPSRDFPVRLLQSGTLKTYDAGQLIATRNEDQSLIRFILSGEAQVLVLDHQNQEISVDTLQAGDMFGFADGPEASHFHAQNCLTRTTTVRGLGGAA